MKIFKNERLEYSLPNVTGTTMFGDTPIGIDLSDLPTNRIILSYGKEIRAIPIDQNGRGTIDAETYLEIN